MKRTLLLASLLVAGSSVIGCASVNDLRLQRRERLRASEQVVVRIVIECPCVTVNTDDDECEEP